MTENEISKIVFECALKVHKNLGPGLLENIYHQCLKKELELRNINYLSEFLIPLNYKGFELESKLRCDLFIENTLVVELKSVAEMNPLFDAQLMTYMNLLNAPIGLLINFNVKNIYYEGQKTIVNNFFNRLDE